MALHRDSTISSCTLPGLDSLVLSSTEASSTPQEASWPTAELRLDQHHAAIKEAAPQDPGSEVRDLDSIRGLGIAYCATLQQAVGPPRTPSCSCLEGNLPG